MNATLSAILGVPDAFDSSPRCGVTTLLPVDPGASVESAAGFATVVAQVTLVWCVLWYASVLFARLWLLKWLPRSSVESENGSFFVGQKFPAMLKVILVSGMANACLWGFQDKSLEQNFLGGPAIEIAGLLFTTFEIADLVLATGHRLMDWEYVVHHLLHIVLGLIIRGNCMTGLLAAVLMAQETSGIFLNYFLLMRNRAPNHWSVTASFVLFALAFFAYRIVLGTYGTYHYVRYYRDYLPPQVPRWQGHLIAPVLVLASILQWYWSVQIGRRVFKKLSGGDARQSKSD